MFRTVYFCAFVLAMSSVAFAAIIDVPAGEWYAVDGAQFIPFDGTARGGAFEDFVSAKSNGWMANAADAPKPIRILPCS